MLLVVFGVLNMVVDYERWDVREFMDSGYLSVVLCFDLLLFFCLSAIDAAQVGEYVRCHWLFHVQLHGKACDMHTEKPMAYGTHRKAAQLRWK